MILDFILGIFTIIGMGLVGLCLVASIYFMFHKDELFEIKQDEDDVE